MHPERTANLYTPTSDARGLDAFAHQFGGDAPRHDGDSLARLGLLAATLAEADERALRFSTPREEREMELMARPVPPGRAYAAFGLLLGTLPPAAIFIRLLAATGASHEPFPWLAAVEVLMLLICALVGRWMGRRVGRILGESTHPTRLRSVSDPILWGFVWAVVTGSLGGLPCFGVGAIFGAVFALLVALPSFLAFALLHRTLARGGMIDARHLRPLAWGITGTTTALILSPYLLPY